MKNKFYNCYMHEQILYAMICSKLTVITLSCLAQFILNMVCENQLASNLLHRWGAKAQMSLGMHIPSPAPQLLTFTIYGSRPKIRFLALLHVVSRVCMFKFKTLLICNKYQKLIQ